MTAGLVAVLVGVTSSIALIFQAAAGATPEQYASKHIQVKCGAPLSLG